MTRPTATYITDITACADQWLCRCNGKPLQGIPISQRGLRNMLGGGRNVTTNATGVIGWTGDAGDFTAEPVRPRTAP